jgi:hypothetical protein
MEFIVNIGSLFFMVTGVITWVCIIFLISYYWLSTHIGEE